MDFKSIKNGFTKFTLPNKKTLKDVDCTAYREDKVKQWYIAHNGNDTYHHGEIEPGVEVLTGQPFLDFYATKEEMAHNLRGDVEKDIHQLTRLPPEEDYDTYEEMLSSKGGIFNNILKKLLLPYYNTPEE